MNLAAFLWLGIALAGSIEDCDGQSEATEVYRCYYRVARAEGLWDEAAARLDAVLVADPEAWWAALSRAHIDSDQGVDAAEQRYRDTIVGMDKIEDAKGSIYARLGLATWLSYAGQNDELNRLLDEAAAVATDAGDDVLIAIVRSQQARAMWQQGEDLGRAFALIQEAEAAAFPEGPYQLQLQVLHVAAGLSEELGAAQDARMYSNRMVELTHDAGDQYVEATARLNAINFTLESQELRESITDAELIPQVEEALAVARAGGNHSSEASALCVLGRLIPGEVGTGHLVECLERHTADEDTAGVVLAQRLLGERWATTNPEEAFARFDAAADLARRTGRQVALGRTLVERAQARWRVGPREQSIADSWEAVDAVWGLRDLQLADASSEVLSAWSHAYHLFAHKTLGDAPSPEDMDMALRFMEQMRARRLLESVAAIGGEEGALGSERSEVLREITAVQLKLSGGNLDSEPLLAELDELEARERRVRAELVAADPNIAHLSKPEIPTTAEIAAQLGPDEALLSFQIAPWHASYREPESWVLVVSSAGAAVYDVHPDADLRTSIPLFNGLLQREERVPPKAAAALYEGLLAEAVAGLPAEVNRLNLVLDGPLHELPFAALDWGEGPVVSRWALSTAPSVATWWKWRQDDEPAFDAAALILGASTEREDKTLSLPPLPFAAAEARKTAAQLGSTTKTLVGAEASEAALKAEGLDRYRLLHFAAHAIHDNASPERAAVVLEAGSPDEDGLLQAREIADLGLNRQIIVLSACSSVSGRVLPGEGVLGLARSFFEAGATTVVGGLWRQRDDQGAAMMARFYEHFRSGLPVDRALQNAQREAIAEGEPPAAWAGLTVLGHGAAGLPPELAPSGPRFWWLGVLALAALIPLMVLGLGSKRRS